MCPEEEKKAIEKKPARAVYKNVRKISSRGKSAVVEWVENKKAFRKIVPIGKIKNDKIDKSILDKSPDYGIPWAKEIKLSASPEDLEKALHNAGIWTPQDAINNPGGIIGALNATYKTDLAKLLRIAKAYINKE